MFTYTSRHTAVESSERLRESTGSLPQVRQPGKETARVTPSSPQRLKDMDTLPTWVKTFSSSKELFPSKNNSHTSHTLLTPILNKQNEADNTRTWVKKGGEAQPWKAPQPQAASLISITFWSQVLKSSREVRFCKVRSIYLNMCLQVQIKWIQLPFVFTNIDTEQFLHWPIAWIPKCSLPCVTL